MKSIINNCDYIAVEDFIFNHLKSTNDILYRKYKFLYIPFTIFTESKQRKYQKTDHRLKVVLTGAIDGDRRRYEDVIDAIDYFKKRSNEITFSFAGRAKGDYGIMIQKHLRLYKTENRQLVSFFENDSTADMFRYEMETSDIVLSASTETFKGMGTLEYIGKTKPTAAIHDMMTYELPGLLPQHLKVPVNLTGSAFNYGSSKELITILEKILGNSSLILEWKEQAKQNSLKFTAKIIRKGLPFKKHL
jgi:glycosyltransferase involved in cell wall biosynthesis